MQKISIKREQSQAGLSFAERENRRSLAGGESKFRPQVKNKLLLLLALLLTAATGAWAANTVTWTLKNQLPTLEGKTTATIDGVTITTPSAITVSSGRATFNGATFSVTEGNITKIVLKSISGVSDYPTGWTISNYTDATWTGSAKSVSCGYSGGVYSIEFTIETVYTVTMAKGTVDAGNWSINPAEAAEGTEVTLTYNGRLKVKGVKATSDAAAAAGNSVDLSTLTADYEAQNGDVLTGETTSYKVTIAAGATVTLDGVNISSSYYCIKCLGDATIILKDGTTNTLTCTGDTYPALSIGDANTTLTIQGSTGVLNVTSGEYCAGIGGGYANTNYTCGNIRIEGGVITAQGGNSGAGIGTDSSPATCGDIIITGGTITANAGDRAAGIGTGESASTPAVCGNITIANTVTKVTATKGEYAAHSIGKGDGNQASCGTVTIGGTKYWENNAAVGDGATYLATSPLEYQP